MNICIRGHNCCQTGGIELSKCVYLTSMGVKIERTVGVQSKDFFSKCISDGHVYRNIGHNQIKTAKIYALVSRNLMIYTEN